VAVTRAKRARAFISYSYEDRMAGAQAQKLLDAANIDAFLAHDDLEVSDEWRERILEELRSCELFVPLLSEHFRQSKWAPQEVGFIVSRSGVVVAPLSLDGTRSFGFISHLQSPRVQRDGITQEVLIEPLARKFPCQVLPAMINTVATAGGFRTAEARMRPLVPLFQLFTRDESETFARAAISNGQIWAAQLCHENYLPIFLDVQGANISDESRRALAFQVEHQRWYNGGRNSE
jgi:hypothetical protein